MCNKKLFFIFIIFAFVCLPVFAKAPLDGKTCVGDTNEKGKTDKTDKDTLHFVDGKFHSVGCDKYGFTAAPYTAKQDGNAWKFEADATSEKEGTIHWSGTVSGNDCVATFLWTKPGQADIEYEFKGTVQ